MNMISPALYEELIYPRDCKIAESFEYFGVHTCNWNVTPYIEVLRKLPKVGYLDMGIMSDLKRVKEAFPDTRRAVLYSPVTLHEAELETIEKDMRKISEELSPCDVVMADIQETTPDRRIRELLAICKRLGLPFTRI